MPVACVIQLLMSAIVAPVLLLAQLAMVAIFSNRKIHLVSASEAVELAGTLTLYLLLIFVVNVYWSIAWIVQMHRRADREHMVTCSCTRTIHAGLVLHLELIGMLSTSTPLQRSDIL